MTDVFISYARSTAKQAQAVAEAVRSLGYAVWIDDELPAHRAYTDVLEERLRAAKAVVVIWSAEAAKSHWVRAEANTALEAGTLVQLTVDGVMPPMPFNQIQCADMTGWTGDTNAPGWRKVVSSIGDLVGGPPITDSQKASAPPPLPSKPSIAVLPFTNLSGDPEQDYFADGMVEEVVTALSRFPSLFVIGAGTGLSFGGAARNLKAIARELGVRYLLEGSVRRSGERVRISVNLTDAVEGLPLWAERFDGTLEDVFTLQDTVAGAVASRIEPSIEDAETRRAGARPTQDLAAYELYLRAYQQYRIYEQPALVAAIALLDAALDRDPRYARALALSANIHTALRLWSWSEDPERSARLSQERNRLALLEGGDDADVLRLVAMTSSLMVFINGGDRAPATALIDRALALNPGASQSWVYSGCIRAFAGQPGLALDHFETALRLDPRLPDRPFVIGFMALALCLLRRFEEAIPLLQEALQLRPHNPGALRSLAVAYAHLGRITEANEAFALLLEVLPQRALLDVDYGSPEYSEIYRTGLALAGADV